MGKYFGTSCEKITEATNKVQKISLLFDTTLSQFDAKSSDFWKRLTAKELETAKELLDPDSLAKREQLAEKLGFDYVTGISEDRAWGENTIVHTISLIDTKNGIVLKEFPDVAVSPFVNGVAFLQTNKDIYRLINLSGKFVSGEIMEPKTLTKETMKSGIFTGRGVVASEEASFYFDKTGSILFDKKGYEKTTPFHDGVAWVERRDGKVALLNEKGEEKIVKNISKIISFTDGLAWVVKSTRGRMDAVYDTEGKEIFKANYAEIHPYSCGRAAVKGNNGWYFIDRFGKRKAGPYYVVSDFDEDRAAVREIEETTEGLACAKNGYLIDPDGNKKSNKYPKLYELSEGMVAVNRSRNGYSETYIDKEGKELEIPFADYVRRDFKDGIGQVRMMGGTRTFYIDKSGQERFERKTKNNF